MRDPRLMLQPRLTASLPAWAGVVLLLAGSAFAVYQAYEAETLLVQVAHKREQVDAARTKAARTVTRLSPEQVRQWQALDAEVAYPWNDFFQAVEQTGSDDIELLEMTPDKLRRQMVLRGEARSNAALTKYVQKLSTQPSLRDVFIVRMRNIERGELLTVEFEIRVAIT